MKIILAILIIAVVLVLLAFSGGLLIYKAVFGKRCDGNRRLKYLTHEDFEGLGAVPVEFTANTGKKLRGALYLRTGIRQPKALVIFSHGFGGGHRSYMTEINTFAKSGFAVLAYDNTGTFASEGDALIGFSQGPADLKAAIEYAKSNPKLSSLKIILAGHSWGAYSVCQALKEKENDVSGAISISAPESGYQAFSGFLGSKGKFAEPLLKLIFAVCDGKEALTKCSDILKNVSVPVLMLHGDCDPTVSPANSPLLSPMIEGKPNITKIMYEGRMHNVYQTKESEEYMTEVFECINALKKIKKPTKEEIDFCYDIDYELITREDPVVMQTIVNFMRNCAGNEA